MSKSQDVLKAELATIRTGKASPDLVNTITVDAYGTPMKLRDIAAVTTPDARLILIQPWDAGNVDSIRKALEESKIGITPMIDGKLIRLPIPPLSEERRHDLVKTVKKLSEEARISVRGNRRNAMDEIKKLQKDGKITEDDLSGAEKEVQKLTDQYIGEIDKLSAQKEAELMKV
jgi:ribosome recycling factor